MGKNYNPATIKRRIKRKANTAKIISKIVHNAEKGKRRQARQRMKSKEVNSVQLEKLKFGAINVDGLDLQTDAALKDLLASRDFDVRSLILFTKLNT